MREYTRDEQLSGTARLATATELRPRLVVIQNGESFRTLWPHLATECDVMLTMTADPGDVAPRSDAIALVVAPGEEEQLEPLVRRLVGSGMEVGAVGARADHRLAGTIGRAGASEYFALPGDRDVLASWLRERFDTMRTAAARATFTDVEREKYRFDGIIGTSAALNAALERAARVIPHPSVTVLLNGETGTGKELVARAIHYQGPRQAAPFVDVNCAAIPDQLLESELFGHERGAFTGATNAKAGLFELAHGGTLLLDEIGHLAGPLQGKLLRVLEERVLRRVGGTRPIPVDVRVIAASHVDLADAVRRGAFREDLYFRLNVVPITLPSLRARREDIVPLARHFITKFAGEYALAEPTLGRSAQVALTARDWPGNVRELRNIIERTLLLSNATTLEPADFITDPEPTAASAPGASTGMGLQPLDATIRAAVHSAVERCRGNKSEAARQLGISRTRLKRLLDDEPDEIPDEA
ncbi:MAG TPA: sigma-54 dependent transcriptional regulator [Gemmatimonadaceae bacterium]|nr:sigma-54 dependent transcriptional regulator [Gemmatimonadaceae bacterium]